MVRIAGSQIRLRSQMRRLVTLCTAVAVAFVGCFFGASAAAGAAPGATVPTGAKTVANARANATGFGGHGGHGSGKAIGRSKVVRTAAPPVLTAAQKALQ